MSRVEAAPKKTQRMWSWGLTGGTMTTWAKILSRNFVLQMTFVLEMAGWWFQNVSNMLHVLNIHQHLTPKMTSHMLVCIFQHHGAFRFWSPRASLGPANGWCCETWPQGFDGVLRGEKYGRKCPSPLNFSTVISLRYDLAWPTGAKCHLC